MSQESEGAYEQQFAHHLVKHNNGVPFVVWRRGGLIVSALVSRLSGPGSSPGLMARDIVLCSWARHFTLAVPHSTQVCKWVPTNLMLGGNPAMD